MKRLTLLLLLATRACNPAAAQEVQLQVRGDTVMVKVPKQITVYEDRLVIKSFSPLPVIVAQPGVGFYRWTVPPQVNATDKGNILQINSAPKGEWTIGLKIESAEVVGDKLKYTTTYSETVIAVGMPGPPPTPNPNPPEPTPVVDPLDASLQAAYAVDPDPSKAANTASLAGLYNVAAEVAYDPVLVTTGDLYTKMKQATTKLKLNTAIVEVRKAIAVELDAVLPTDPKVALNETIRKTAADTFKRVESSLGKCK